MVLQEAKFALETHFRRIGGLLYTLPRRDGNRLPSLLRVLSYGRLSVVMGGASMDDPWSLLCPSDHYVCVWNDVTLILLWRIWRCRDDLIFNQLYTLTQWPTRNFSCRTPICGATATTKIAATHERCLPDKTMHLPTLYKLFSQSLFHLVHVIR